MDLSKSELRKMAQMYFDQGMSRQDVLGIMRNEISNQPSDIAKVLRYMPTAHEKEKFLFLKIILISVLSISVLGAVALAVSMIIDHGLEFLPVLFLFPAINIIFIVLIILDRGRIYQSIVVLSLISIWQTIKHMGNGDEGGAILIGMGLNVVMIIVAAIAHFNLTKNYSVTKKRVEQENHTVKMEDVIVFDE